MALPSLTAGDLVTRGPNYISISGDVVTDDNAVCIDTGNLLNVASYNKWALSTTAGVLDVFVDLGSGTFTTAPLSLFDGGGTAWNTTVLVTVANRIEQTARHDREHAGQLHSMLRAARVQRGVERAPALWLSKTP